MFTCFPAYFPSTSVLQVVNMLSAYFAFGRDSPQLARHAARLDDYLWVAEDGMKMQVCKWVFMFECSRACDDGDCIFCNL